jgi:hypothetical protein
MKMIKGEKIEKEENEKMFFSHARENFWEKIKFWERKTSWEIFEGKIKEEEENFTVEILIRHNWEKTLKIQGRSEEKFNEKV